jgi:protein tyrosine kinase
MTDVPATTPEIPADICGYPVDCALSDKDSYLAIGPGGRGVVVKRMEDDCILKGQLHPAVRERLGRVREIAHGGVANLFGIERDAGRTWLIWEYVQGKPFDDYAANPERSLRELAAAGREVALALDLLHLQGIVHGAVHGGNVIVSPGGAVRLTHVSPLLYSDPAHDADAVAALLESAVALRGGENSSLGWLLARAREERLGLRALAARLAALIESRELEDTAGAHADEDHRPRRRALYGAVAVALFGAGAGVAAWRMAVSPELRTSVHDKVHGWFVSRDEPSVGKAAGAEVAP